MNNCPDKSSDEWKFVSFRKYEHISICTCIYIGHQVKQIIWNGYREKSRDTFELNVIWM